MTRARTTRSTSRSGRHRMPGEPAWESPWGPGRPGWHAECAAMALHAFGPAVDVQAGGGDLRFPHHAYQAAMAEAFTGVTPFARARLNAGVVRVAGAKMAKSAGQPGAGRGAARRVPGGGHPAADPGPAMGRRTGTTTTPGWTRQPPAWTACTSPPAAPAAAWPGPATGRRRRPGRARQRSRRARRARHRRGRGRSGRPDRRLPARTLVTGRPNRRSPARRLRQPGHGISGMPALLGGASAW